MIPKIIAIAGNTYLETIRQPVYGIVVGLTYAMMMLNMALAAFTLSNDNLFLRDLGLSTLLVSGLFLAAFSAAGVLNREIENKTVLTLISKPISRPALIVGKFIGLISALTTAFYLSTLAFLLVVRHGVLQNTTDPWNMPVIIFGGGAVLLSLVIAGIGNYWNGWQFSSTLIFLNLGLLTVGALIAGFVDVDWEVHPIVIEAQLLGSITLVLLMVWIITAIALAASCRIGQIPTLMVCLVVLAVGLTSDYVFGRHQFEDLGLWNQPSVVSMAAWVLYRIIPNLGVFWVADAVTAGKDLSLAYVTSAGVYAGMFICAFLAIGVGIFQKREVG